MTISVLTCTQTIVGEDDYTERLSVAAIEIKTSVSDGNVSYAIQNQKSGTKVYRSEDKETRKVIPKYRLFQFLRKAFAITTDISLHMCTAESGTRFTCIVTI